MVLNTFGQVEVTPREAIFKKLRQAIIEKIRNPYPDLDLDSPVLGFHRDSSYAAFAEAVTRNQATFTYCENVFSMLDHLVSLMEKNRWRKMFSGDVRIQAQLKEIGIETFEYQDQVQYADAVIAWAETAISSTGTMVFTSKQTDLRLLAGIPIWVILVDVKSITQDVKETIQVLKGRYGRELPSQIFMSTGLGQTFELEFIAHSGAFTPEQVFVMMVENDAMYYG